MLCRGQTGSGDEADSCAANEGLELGSSQQHQQQYWSKGQQRAGLGHPTALPTARLGWETVDGVLGIARGEAQNRRQVLG